MAANSNFSKTFLIIIFSLGLVMVGTKELHKRYTDKMLNKTKPAEKLTPQDYVTIFYGSGKIEQTAFGKNVKAKEELSRRDPLNEEDKQDITRLFRKLFQ